MQAEVPHAQAVQEPPQPLQPRDAAAGVTLGQRGHSESLSPGFCCQTRAERFIPGAKSGMRKQKITWGRWLRNRQALLFFFYGPAHFQSNSQEPFDSHSPCKKNWLFYRLLKDYCSLTVL